MTILCSSLPRRLCVRKGSGHRELKPEDQQIVRKYLVLNQNKGQKEGQTHRVMFRPRPCLLEGRHDLLSKDYEVRPLPLHGAHPQSTAHTHLSVLLRDTSNSCFVMISRDQGSLVGFTLIAIGTKWALNVADHDFVKFDQQLVLFLRKLLAKLSKQSQKAHTKEPAVGTGDFVLLVDEGDLGESSDDVLHLSVVHVTVLATKVVKPGDLVKEEVNNGDDDGDTNGVGPDNNDGDNIGPAIETLVLEEGGRRRGVGGVTRQPTEETEDGGEGINTENGEDELPVGEGLATTGNEDEPVLSKSNLKEENLLNGTEVLDDTTTLKEESTTDDPGTGSEKDTEDDGDDPNLGKLPLDGTLLRVSVIVGNGDGGQIGEEGDEDDEVGTDGLVDDDHGSGKVKLQVQAQGDTVLNVSLHTLEDLAGSLDGVDDGGKTGSKEDDIGGSLSSLSGTLDSDTTVRLLERRSVVDTVTSHGSQVTTLLEHLDDLVLVLGEDLSETISLLNEIVLGSTGETTVDELSRVVNLGTESKHLASLLGNSDSVTSKHLDGNTKLLSLNDGLGGVLTRRATPRERKPRRANSVALSLKRSAVSLSQSVRLRTALGAPLAQVSELLSLPLILEDLTSLGVTLEGKDGNLVDGVEGLDVVGRGEGGDGHHPVDVLTLGDERLTDRELVGSESTGLVRAENINTSEGLDGSELLYDSLLLGEVGGTDGKSGGGNDGKTDGDTNNEEDKSVAEKSVLRPFGGSEVEVAEETTDPGSENEEHDENEKSRTDGVHDSLEVTLILGTSDESSSATDERVLGRGDEDSVGLSALATSGVVDDIAHVLVDSKRFTGNGRLVSGDDGVALVSDTGLLTVTLLRASGVLLGVQGVLLTELLVLGEILRGIVVTDKTGITRDGRTLLDDDNVTGDELTGEDVLLLTVADDSGSHGDITLKRGNDIGSLLFLVPTDDGVQHKNTDDDTEIDPITQTCCEKDSKFHNCR
ncbi:plasma membrane H+-ATPase Pma1, partial [Aureobasidium melanogenum]